MSLDPRKTSALPVAGEGQRVPGDLSLVFGASGYIGTNLVPFLQQQGRRVRATSRHSEVLEGRGWRDVDIRTADALDPGSLDAVLQDIDTAYYLVHSMAAGDAFPEIDVTAASNFAAAAARQKIRRIVYLGGLVPEAPRSAHLSSRAQTGETLRAGEVPVTELRAAMIIGPGSAAWEVIRDLVNHLPVMVTPRWVFSRSTPIALQNLLHYLAEAPQLAETAHGVYDVGGPDVLTYADIMRGYGAIVGKSPLIIPVPLLTPRLSALWLRLVTSVPTNVARALIDGLSQDVLATDERLAALIPQRLLTFEESARAALAADRQHDVPAHWAENATVCRNFRPEYSFYAKQASGHAITDASAANLWTVILTMGNEGDFFWGRLLWWLRRAIDWASGGPSCRRRRRHPQALRVGDVVDSWRVIEMEPGKKLTLLMEMKAPGSGVLEFLIADNGSKRTITMRAFFHPAGVRGLLYWYALLPVHELLFAGSTREIARRAEGVAER